jgi:hypothetical protein
MATNLGVSWSNELVVRQSLTSKDVKTSRGSYSVESRYQAPPSEDTAD